MTDLTIEQVEILVNTAAEADGGCSVCVAGVTRGLLEAFPGVPWVRLIADRSNGMTYDELLQRCVPSDL